jgi:hypothetical protein
MLQPPPIPQRAAPFPWPAPIMEPKAKVLPRPPPPPHNPDDEQLVRTPRGSVCWVLPETSKWTA